jgi:RNA polymerase sigma-70 factor (ECF subfamily)
MEGDAENLPVLLAENLNQSFEQLVLRYQDQLYAFVLARVGEASTAEEIVQSALIRAYYALRQYPPERIRALKLSAWLYEITRNTLYNERRDHQACAAQRTVEPFDLSEESPLLLLEDQRRTPDEELSRREERRELEAQIELLPVPYQTAIRLYYFDNLSYREIADRLKLPVGTVKSHVHRGMQLLRVQMKEA